MCNKPRGFPLLLRYFQETEEDTGQISSLGEAGVMYIPQPLRKVPVSF